MQCTGTELYSPRKRIASRMSSGPVEQLRPIASTSSASSVASAELMSVPSSILPPCGSSEMLHWIGIARPESAHARRTPNTAALSSRMSWVVSMITRSTPPASSPCVCSANTSTSSGNVILPSVGSSLAGKKPVGPMAPATNRCSPAALRAICAALRLISCVWSSSPHSASFSLEAWKLSVSSTSAPGLEHRGVNALDHVGPVEHQHLVTPPRQLVVVLEAQLELLQSRAHSPVVDDRSLAGQRR